MNRRHEYRAAALIVLCVALPIYLVRLNTAAGLVVDDGWYVMLAKALADGLDYELINAPVAGILPGYPPGFPALLSIVFRVLPEFPENVWLLKSVSIAAMLAVGVLAYAYVRRRQIEHELGVCIAVAVTITPALVFLATSTLMTESVFTMLQLATVLLIHRSADAGEERRTSMLTITAALTASAAVLIRSAGIGLALAGGLWLLKERMWKRAAMFGAAVAICLLPWLVYARLNAPTPAQQLLHGGSIVYSYGEQFWMRWAGYPAAGVATVRDLPARVGTNLEDIFARGIGGLFIPTLLRGPSESGEEMVALGGAMGLTRGSMGVAGATMAVSLVLSAIVVVGFVQVSRARVTVGEVLVIVSLAITLIWPFWTFRFVIPLAPYLFFYLAMGIRAVAPVNVAPLVFLCFIGLNLSDHARYVLAARDVEANRVSWLMQSRGTDEVLDWAKRNLRDGVVATTNPGLVYLRTGHRTVAFDKPMDDWTVWRRRGVRYVISLVAVDPPTSNGPFTLLYRSATGYWVIEI